MSWTTRIICVTWYHLHLQVNTCTLIIDNGKNPAVFYSTSFKDATSRATFQNYFLGNFQQLISLSLRKLSFCTLPFHRICIFVLVILSILPIKCKLYY